MSAAATDTGAVSGRLYDLLRSFFKAPDLVIGPQTTAQDIKGWDSLAHVRLMIEIERTFKIRFATSEIARMSSIGDLTVLVAAKTSAR